MPGSGAEPLTPPACGAALDPSTPRGASASPASSVPSASAAPPTSIAPSAEPAALGSLSPSERALLEAIRDARQRRYTLRSWGDGWNVDLAGAYRIQAALQAGSVKGYKLGLLSPAKQAQMGISTPIWGRIRPAMLADGPISLKSFLQPRVEPELAVLLRAPIPPDATPGAAWAAIAGFVLCADVLDSVWEGYRFSAPEVIADNASAGACVLGERLLGPEKLEGTLRLHLDGRVLSEGPVASLGDPGQRLCWLASQTGGLAAGQVVALGSPAAAVELQPGLLEITLADASLWRRVEG